MTGSVVPAGASITRRFGAIMLEAAVFLFLYWLLSLVFPALGQGVELWQDPAPVLVLAAVRILGEAGWGTSPGKRLTGLMVVFSDRTGQTVTGSRGRLPLTVLRNGWLWLPPVMLLINPEHSWYNALASVVALTLLLRWDNRSLFDQLAGAEVLSATQTVSAPDPRQTPWPLASPAQRALAWLVDLAVAGVVGAVLLTVSGWNWWALTLVVLGTLRLLAEWIGLPTPGKAALGLRVYYLPWFNSRAMIFLQVVVRNLWVVPAAALAVGWWSGPLLVEGVVMVSILLTADHRSLPDLAARAHVTARS